MIPVEHNFEMCRGDTHVFTVRFPDFEDDEVTQLYFTIKKKAKQIENTVQKKFGVGITEIEKNYYYVRIAPEDTRDIPAGRYVYDLSFELGEDVFTPLMETVNIIQDVTYNE